MELLRKMGLLADSEGQRHGGEAGQGLKGAAADRENEYSILGTGSALMAPDAQALHIRELSMLLAEARQQVNTYRRQLAARSVPAEELTYEMKRVRVGPATQLHCTGRSTSKQSHRV